MQLKLILELWGFFAIMMEKSILAKLELLLKCQKCMQL